MTVYMDTGTQKKLKKLADSEKRSLSKQVEVLIESYEKKNTNDKR